MMLKLSLISVFIFLCIFSRAEKYPGYFISENNDTVRVILKVRTKLGGALDFERMQRKVKFVTEDGTKGTLYPETVKEIMIIGDMEIYRLVSVVDNLSLGGVFHNGKNIFLHQLINGTYMKLYRYYQTRQYTTTTTTGQGVSGGVYHAGTTTTNYQNYKVEQYILQKTGQELFRTGWFNFKSNMKGYVYECPDLVERIDDREFRRSEMEEIVSEYNYCLSQKYNAVTEEPMDSTKTGN